LDFWREVRKVEEMMGRERRDEIHALEEGERVRIM